MARYDAYIPQSPALATSRGWLVSALIGSLIVHLSLYFWFSGQEIHNFSALVEPSPKPEETLQRIKITEDKKQEEIKAVVAEVNPSNEKRELLIPKEMPRSDEISVAPQHKLLDPSKLFSGEKPEIEMVKITSTSKPSPDDLLPKLDESFFKSDVTGPKITARKPTDLDPDGDGTARAIQVAGQDVEGILGGLTSGTGNSRRLSLPGNLTFGYDDADISEEGRGEMEKIAEAFRKFLGEDLALATFIIEGHTDPTGTPEYNQKLSERRAESVRAWFIENLRINPARIEIRGYGATRPVEGVPLEGTVEEMQGHRRTEIIVRRPKKS